ncbi:hypothetical protein [Sphingosinicella xenopeptidilytica]|uniref:Uncharacterized protein n=1 Tax=Sphingosinicella xenopeptidilytica TaxID=364098 RepID=A0ABW3C3K3_SPHXN
MLTHRKFQQADLPARAERYLHPVPQNRHTEAEVKLSTSPKKLRQARPKKEGRRDDPGTRFPLELLALELH